jgi:hypothetical protein
MNRTILPYSLIVLLALAVGIVGCGKKEQPKPAAEPTIQAPPPAPKPTVTNVVFARGVDASWNPVNPATEFKPKDRVNVVIKTENIVPGNILAVQWFYLGTNQLVKADSAALKNTGANTSSFFIERAKGFPAGDYRLDVVLNGMVVRSDNFSVKP